MEVWVETFILWGMAINVRNVRLSKYLYYSLVTWKKQCLHRKWTKPLDRLTKVATTYLLTLFSLEGSLITALKMMTLDYTFCMIRISIKWLTLFTYGVELLLFLQKTCTWLWKGCVIFLRNKCIVTCAGDTWNLFGLHSPLQRTFSCWRGSIKL